MRCVDIGHGNWRVGRGSEQAAGDLADRRAAGHIQSRVLAHRHALQRPQANAHAGAAAVDLWQQDGCTDEATGACAAIAAHFLHRPQQIGLRGRRVLIDVVAIQAQAGFQPQRIACTQANGLDFGLLQEGAGKGKRRVRGDGDFKPVFAGVAAAGEKDFTPMPDKALAGHEDQPAHTRHQALQRGGGQRPLQGQQRRIGQRRDLATRTDVPLHMGGICHLAGPVDDDQKIRRAAGEHQVIQDAGVGIEQHAVALAPGCEADDVDRHERLQSRHSVNTDNAELPHVRDIKQAGCVAGVQVFGHQACRILNRHAVTGKGNHARTQFQVQVVQRGAEQGGFGAGCAGRCIGQKGLHACGHPPWGPGTLLSALPERFIGCTCSRFAPSVGDRLAVRHSPTR